MKAMELPEDEGSEDSNVPDNTHTSESSGNKAIMDPTSFLSKMEKRIDELTTVVFDREEDIKKYQKQLAEADAKRKGEISNLEEKYDTILLEARNSFKAMGDEYKTMMDRHRMEYQDVVRSVQTIREINDRIYTTDMFDFYQNLSDLIEESKKLDGEFDPIFKLNVFDADLTKDGIITLCQSKAGNIKTSFFKIVALLEIIKSRYQTILRINDSIARLHEKQSITKNNPQNV